MLRLKLPVCSKCRHSLLGTHSESWPTLAGQSFRRQHTSAATGDSKRANGDDGHVGCSSGDRGSSSRACQLPSSFQTSDRYTSLPMEDFHDSHQKLDSIVTTYVGSSSGGKNHHTRRTGNRHTLLAASSELRSNFGSISLQRHRSSTGSAKSRRAETYAAPWNRPQDPSTRSWSRNDRRPATPAHFPLWEPSSRRTPSPTAQTTPRVDPANIPPFFESQVQRWSQARGLQRRFESFGIPADEVQPLLRVFVRTVQAGKLSTAEGHERYNLIRFASSSEDEAPSFDIQDIIYSTILFTWAGDPSHSALLSSAGLSADTITRIQALARAGDRSFPAEEFPDARKMHRKVIMHVGPTNSGKTHNALRALAAAGSGVYAGPLRLLAHEIWERLNMGQIVPLGMEELPVPLQRDAERETDSALDIGEKAPAVRRLGNPKYARACNMITGEEQKIVSDTAPLLSCTVEMLSFRKPFDVAVVDEIQMIADEGRGSGWTAAVLGLCAKELHLCGEETAVPVVRELLKETGDELVVHRYKRLSPLEVEEESLEGDFSRVRKGDCIVTFSRSNIFAIKRRIESMTSMRCAVVYGMLPPEIRSEQAALFNDPDSGYDVIIGSDAIGMGLNLKIRRIIFEAVRKWDGISERPLSVSQTKQIAGRAGRYGMHGASEPCGYTTALFPSDVAFIRRTLELPVSPLPFARIGPTKESFQAFALALPPSASTHAIYEAHRYISRLPPMLRYAEVGASRLRDICEFVDTRGPKLPLGDRLNLVQAPVAWRDPACMELVARFVGMYQEEMDVDLMKALEGTEFMANLERIEEKMREEGRRRASAEVLGSLESFHKALVLYVWMSFRQPLAWNSHEEVAALKTRVEKGLDWTLQALTRNQPADKGWKEHLQAQRSERSKQIQYSSLREVKHRRTQEQVTTMAAQA